MFIVLLIIDLNVLVFFREAAAIVRVFQIIPSATAITTIISAVVAAVPVPAATVNAPG